MANKLLSKSLFKITIINIDCSCLASVQTKLGSTRIGSGAFESNGDYAAIWGVQREASTHVLYSSTEEEKYIVIIRHLPLVDLEFSNSILMVDPHD